MDLESYLIDIKYPILAINKLAKLSDNSISENYSEIINGKAGKDFVDNLQSLNTAILMITYCMMEYRQQVYKELDSSHSDNFTVDSMIYER